MILNVSCSNAGGGGKNPTKSVKKSYLWSARSSQTWLCCGASMPLCTQPVRSGQIHAVICFHCVRSDVKRDRAPRVGRVTSVSWEKAFPCATQNRREVELEVPFSCLFSSLSPTRKNYGSSEATGTLGTHKDFLMKVKVVQLKVEVIQRGRFIASHRSPKRFLVHANNQLLFERA